MNKEEDSKNSQNYKMRSYMSSSPKVTGGVKKRGNSLDPKKEKHIDIDERPKITNLITQFQRKQQPLTPTHQAYLYIFLFFIVVLLKTKDYFPYLPQEQTRKKFIYNLREKLLPPQQSKYIGKKTLVLDLDETLVHSGFKSFNPSDIVLKIEFEGVIHDIHVLIRPGADEFLARMANSFEIVVFTASLSKVKIF